MLARSSGYSSSTGGWGYNYTYHADGGGNITYAVASNGTKMAEYRYDSFGRTLSVYEQRAFTGNRYRFSSKEVHLRSGMYYYGYRLYNPSTGRWVNRDPIGEKGGLNLYSVLSNDLIDAIDYLGLEIIKVWAAAFISPDSLVFPYGTDPFALWHGDARGFGVVNGSSRNWHLVIIDTALKSVRVNEAGSGMTQVTYRNLLGQAKTAMDKAPDPPKGSVSFVNAGCTVIVRVANDARSGKVPLVPFAPPLRYDYTIVLNLTDRHGQAFGFHTVYPWHEIVVESDAGTSIPISASPSGPTFVQDMFFGPQDLIHFISEDVQFGF
jgi:RHS repeat-associated protein